jgi:hypothetical protein
VQAELILVWDMAQRGRRMIEALRDTAPIPVRVSEAYTGKAEILITYGTGHPIRRPWWEAHRRKGGRCIGLDLGYWNRADPDAAMRVTLDTDHPPQWMRAEPAARWNATGIKLREDADPKGPIVLVGSGRKSLQVLRERPLQWEAGVVPRLRSLGREIVYRPKRPTDPAPKGMRALRQEPIEDALRGASLVVCRHSNVAIDACIAGVPVACNAGAASALYGKDPCEPKMVTRAQRLAFLQGLAWWNWRPSEAAQAWPYLLDRIQCG